MSAQPFHEHQPPRIKRTIKSIRSALPPAMHAQFDDELAEAFDAADLAATARFKDRWFGQAMIESDPQLRADLDAAARGELEFFPSPFAR
jgi:hypothetical protein